MQRVVWILFNYISFLAYTVAILFVMEANTVVGRIISKSIIFTPTNEYVISDIKSPSVGLFIDDNSVMFLMKMDANENMKSFETQPVNGSLKVAYYKNIINHNSSLMEQKIAGLDTHDSIKDQYRDSLDWYPEEELLTLHRLDSFRVDLEEMISNDFHLSDSLRMHSKFLVIVNFTLLTMNI